jgi:hypothetical protein
MKLNVSLSRLLSNTATTNETSSPLIDPALHAYRWRLRNLSLPARLILRPVNVHYHEQLESVHAKSSFIFAYYNSLVGARTTTGFALLSLTAYA